MPDDRTRASALAGPVIFSATGDWTRWSRYFGLEVSALSSRAVRSVAFDTRSIGQTWSLNPNRFHVGPASGVTAADITFTVSPDQTLFTLNFAPGSFGPGDSFRFGMSVFAPIEGSTQQDPDRFRGMKITVTLEDGTRATSAVTAPAAQSPNRFTGAGLVNAQAAVTAAQK